MTTKAREKRDAKLWEALIPIVGALLILFFTSAPLFTKEFSFHVSLSLGILLAAIIAIVCCGYSWSEIEEEMIQTIRRTMNLIIFVAAFNLFFSSSIVAGTLPTLVYYLSGNAAIAEAYKINFILFIIPIIVIIMIIRKFPVIPSIVVGVFLNIIAAKLFQGTAFADIVVNTHYGGSLETGNAFFDVIISKLNGYDASMWLIFLIIAFVMFTAILKKIGFMKKAEQ